MKILSLDLSTNTGWAVLEPPNLIAFGQIEHSPKNRQELYPLNYINCAKEIASRIHKIKGSYGVDCVVIEETNQGATSRYAQKLLEFVHFAVADSLISNDKIHPIYLSSRKWQSAVGATLNKDQRKINKELKNKRELAKANLKKQIEEDVHREYLSKFQEAPSKQDARLVTKEAKNKVKERFAKATRSLRVSLPGVDGGKVTSKHLAVQKVNELFKLDLKQKDNGIADAILLGIGFYKIQKENTGNGSTVANTNQ